MTTEQKPDGRNVGLSAGLDVADASAALCPACCKPATKVMNKGGWRFNCKPCRRSWGHPQFMSYDCALDSLDAARELTSNAEIHGQPREAWMSRGISCCISKGATPRGG